MDEQCFVIKKADALWLACRIEEYWTGKQWTENKAKAKRYRLKAGEYEVLRLRESKHPFAFLVADKEISFAND